MWFGMANSRKIQEFFTIRQRKALLSLILATVITSAKVTFKIIGVLFSGENDKDGVSEDGDLIGDYNFRTRKFDDGTDPYGWYEEDL